LARGCDEYSIFNRQYSIENKHYKNNDFKLTFWFGLVQDRVSTYYFHSGIRSIEKEYAKTGLNIKPESMQFWLRNVTEFPLNVN